MKKFFTFLLSAFITLVLTTMSFGQAVVFEDNFDTYTAGGQLACQNPTDWTTWSNLPCDPTEDAFISNNYAYSGTNSFVVIQDNDLVKPMGTQTSGKWDISFMVYVPVGKEGYFNYMAEFFGTPQWWALDVYFEPGGSGRLNAGGQNAATFTYAYDTWQSVEVIVDLNNDIGEFWFDGDSVHSWQWTLGSVGQGVPLQLDAVNFWGPNANAEMYVDNFVFTDLLAPFSDDFESYTVGGQLACQNPVEWTTWNLIPCDANEDAYVSDLYAFSGSNSVVIVQNNDLVKPFGDLTSGIHIISFMVYIPTGKTGVFSTMSGFTGGAYEWAMSVEFNPGGNGEIAAGGWTAATFTYAYDTWQSVEIGVNLDADEGTFWFDGTMVYTWQWTLGALGGGSALQLAAINFWSLSANDEMYIDDFGFYDLITSVENEIDVKGPLSFSLEQNYPNPFNPTTTIRFTISDFGFTILRVYDVLGREVATLVNEDKPVGSYEVEFDATKLPSGIYFYRLQADNFVETKKMVLMK
jgi:hypothetical protein